MRWVFIDLISEHRQLVLLNLLQMQAFCCHVGRTHAYLFAIDLVLLFLSPPLPLSFHSQSCVTLLVTLTPLNYSIGVPPSAVTAVAL